MKTIMTKQLSFWGDMPAKTVVILVSGKAGVGKTTLAHMLKEEIWGLGQYHIVVKSFANGVKKCARDFFGWDGRKDKEGRELLQKLGTDLGRAINENVWIDYLIHDVYSNTIVPPDFIIIDDWRFPNELTRFYDFGEFQTLSIRVIAPEREILKNTPQYNHPSEIALDDFEFDVLVYNTGTMEELKNTAKQIIERSIKYVTN